MINFHMMKPFIHQLTLCDLIEGLSRSPGVSSRCLSIIGRCLVEILQVKEHEQIYRSSHEQTEVESKKSEQYFLSKPLGKLFLTVVLMIAPLGSLFSFLALCCSFWVMSLYCLFCSIWVISLDGLLINGQVRDSNALHKLGKKVLNDTGACVKIF